MVAEAKDGSLAVTPDLVLACPQCGARDKIASGIWRIKKGQTRVMPKRFCKRCAEERRRPVRGVYKRGKFPPRFARYTVSEEDRALLRARMERPAVFLSADARREFAERVDRLRALVGARSRGVRGDRKVFDLHGETMDAAHDIVDMMMFMDEPVTWDALESPERADRPVETSSNMSTTDAARILEVAERRLARLRREPA